VTVTLTAPVEGKQPGETYTGANEAYHLASGNAKQDGYTGPGVANTGAADTTIANNREFDATRGNIARDSDLGDGGGTNTNVVLGPADAPFPVVTGNSAQTSIGATSFDGFANDPAADITSVTKADGTAATGLATAGGTALVAHGYDLSNATGVTVGGTAVTAVSADGHSVQFTTPAKAAGTYDVVVQRPEGNLTQTGAVTYA
jgi:IPT/TIG domain